MIYIYYIEALFSSFLIPIRNKMAALFIIETNGPFYSIESLASFSQKKRGSNISLYTKTGESLARIVFHYDDYLNGTSLAVQND